MADLDYQNLTWGELWEKDLPRDVLEQKMERDAKEYNSLWGGDLVQDIDVHTVEGWDQVSELIGSKIEDSFSTLELVLGNVGEPEQAQEPELITEDGAWNPANFFIAPAGYEIVFLHRNIDISFCAVNVLEPEFEDPDKRRVCEQMLVKSAVRHEMHHAYQYSKFDIDDGDWREAKKLMEPFAKYVSMHSENSIQEPFERVNAEREMESYGAEATQLMSYLFQRHDELLEQLGYEEEVVAEILGPEQDEVWDSRGYETRFKEK